MEKKQQLYSGKAKSVYATDNKDLVVLSFRDDTSAFDGEKVEQLSRKGEVNNKFNAHIMQYLEQNGIPTHFDTLLNDTESVVKNLQMIPVECVVRNVASGSLCRRLGVEDGMELSPPVFEFFLKNDALHDPMINEYHIETFGWAKSEDVSK
jgi:phosphoribosylaminoimidazole-succinocarboxamide synthase